VKFFFCKSVHTFKSYGETSTVLIFQANKSMQEDQANEMLTPLLL